MEDPQSLESLLARVPEIVPLLEAINRQLSVICFAVCSASAGISFQVILYAARNKNFWG